MNLFESFLDYQQGSSLMKIYIGIGMIKQFSVLSTSNDNTQSKYSLAWLLTSLNIFLQEFFGHGIA
jgi:hypothetical protein